MIEHCECCLAPAPPWEDEEYLEWHLDLGERGDYLGIVCPGCFAGEGLAFLAVLSATP